MSKVLAVAFNLHRRPISNCAGRNSTRSGATELGQDCAIVPATRFSVSTAVRDTCSRARRVVRRDWRRSDV